MEMRKISRRHPRAVDGAELGHFTLLFCRGRQRNVQKVKTHVILYLLIKGQMQRNLDNFSFVEKPL